LEDVMNPTVARKLLQDERSRLERIRQGVYDALGDPTVERAALAEAGGGDQHPADLGSERFEREKDLSIVNNIDGELGEVDSAMRRLDDGEYGRCEVCHRPIGAARLRARPAARFCVKDQASMERQVRSA
jgi:RNA polymerase-binding transcription factor DksA